MAALHDGAGHQADVSATGAATKNPRARLEKTERLADDAAPWAGEPITPAGLFEISGTRRVVRENAAEIPGRDWGKDRSSRGRISMANMTADASPGGCLRQPDRHGIKRSVSPSTATPQVTPEPSQSDECSRNAGDPGRTRTCDQQLRRNLPTQSQCNLVRYGANTSNPLILL